ncbi:hypothetical protein VPH35_014229 [Triticum aestivum]
MGSSEHLSSPMPTPEYPDTHESETNILDGHEKVVDHVPVVERKRKRGGLMDEEPSVFSSMTEAVKEVATAIRESKTADAHPSLYSSVMEMGGFGQEALMAALSHLLNIMARGLGFVGMGGGGS